MSNALKKSFDKFHKTTAKEPEKLSGMLGIPLGGKKLVEVPNRPPYVYVRLRNNQNELIQAFNNKVSPSYDLPVLVVRDGNRYVIWSVDTKRYENNWSSFAPYLPRHAETHSFDPENGGGGDTVFIYSRQLIPLLSLPSGSLGGPNVLLRPYTFVDTGGIWKTIGNTGTPNLTVYNPTGTNAVLVLISIDSMTGNPHLTVGSGSVFPNSITGTAEIVPYLPSSPDQTRYIPDSAIRLITGTTTIGWDNIYDVRQFLRILPTGTANGGGSIFIQDEGISQGTATTFNFTGPNVDASISGSVVRVFVTGSVGGGIPSGTIQLYNTGTFVGSANKLDFQYPLFAGFTGTRGYPSINGTLLNFEDVSAQITGSNTHFKLTGTIALGTDRLYYNGLRQKRSTHYVVDSDGKGFSTLFTGTSGDNLIMDYGNLGTSPQISANTSIQDEGVLQGSVGGFNFRGSSVSVTVSGTWADVYVSGATGTVSFPKSGHIWPDTFLVTGTQAFQDYITITHDSSQNWGFYGDTVGYTGTMLSADIYCAAGLYKFSFLKFLTQNGGKFDFYLDNVLIQSGIDFYAASNTYNQTTLVQPVTVPYDGRHIVKLIGNGKNASSVGLVLYLTCISFYPLSVY